MRKWRRFFPIVALAILSIAPWAKASEPSSTPYPCKSYEDPWIEIIRPQRKLRFWCGHTVYASYPIAVGAPNTQTTLGYYRLKWMESYPPGKTGAVTAVFLAVYYDERTNAWVGIHGTSYRDSIGQAASRGCIRMREEDALKLKSWAVKDMVIWITEQPFDQHEEKH